MSLVFLAFVAICLVLVGTTIARPHLIYEFPYFMAVAFTVFILPQAYTLYKNEWGGGYLETTFLMCLLCVGSCWVGYHARPHPKVLEKLNVSVAPARFFAGGVVITLVGCYFMYRAAVLPEAIQSEQTVGNTGIGTVYLFFGDLVYPGFAICFYCAIRERWMAAWAASAIAAVVPISRAVFSGRREPTALFIISLGLTLFFVRNLRPPRLLIIVMVIGAAVVLPATGEYRALAGEEGLGALAEIDFGEQLKASQDEDAISELKNATALIAATQITGYYEYGAGYWNAMVFRFVPAQFVGKELKESLMVGGQQREYGDFVESVLGNGFPIGTTPTGIGDSFNEFGYLGCIFFLGLGYLFKSLWAAANRPGAIVAQVFYIQLVTTAMRTITHQTIDFLPGFAYSAIFIGVIVWYAREQSIPQSAIPPRQRTSSTPSVLR